jgi:hypothetical protein
MSAGASASWIASSCRISCGASGWVRTRSFAFSFAIAVSVTVHTINLALFPVWSGLFLGLGLLLVAVALWRSAEYVRICAAFELIGASMCLFHQKTFAVRVYR